MDGKATILCLGIVFISLASASLCYLKATKKVGVNAKNNKAMEEYELKTGNATADMTSKQMDNRDQGKITMDEKTNIQLPLFPRSALAT